MKNTPEMAPPVSRKKVSTTRASLPRGFIKSSTTNPFDTAAIKNPKTRPLIRSDYGYYLQIDRMRYPDVEILNPGNPKRKGEGREDAKDEECLKLKVKSLAKKIVRESKQ